MQNCNPVALAAEVRYEIFGYGYRTVSAPSASNGYCKIGLALSLILRKREAYEIEHLLEEGFCERILMNIPRDFRGKACQRSELRHVMRVCKEADVKDEIGINRYTVFEAERFYGDLKLGTGPLTGCFRKQPAKLRGAQAGGVDDLVGAGTNFVEHGAFRANCLEDGGSAAKEGMRTACLFETAHQDIICRIQENDFRRSAAIRQLVQNVRELFKGFANTRIYAYEQSILSRCEAGIRERRKQTRRNIIHRVVADIAEVVERGRLPRAREASYDYEAHKKATGESLRPDRADGLLFLIRNELTKNSA